MTTNGKLNFEIKDDGTVFFDLYDFLYGLEGDDLANMIEALSWQEPVIQRIVGNLKTRYASDFTNANLHRIRRLFFTPESEFEKTDILARMKNTMKAILSELAREKEERARFQQAWKKVYENICLNFGDQVAQNLNQIYYGAAYNPEWARNRVTREMTNISDDIVDKSGMIEEWVEKMIEFFSENECDKDEQDSR